MKYQASPKYFVPRGTDDLLPGEVEKWQWMEETARKICRLYGFREIRTPLFEHTEIYQRGVGEATDIVEKEMYSFYDRGERALTLRPEGTAGVVRSFVEKKVFADPQPTKWYYIGPMFRYENPQAGRRRQFHQFGVEVFGSADPALDAEVIALGMHFYQALELEDVRVEINSVGDQETRERYRKRLIDYFEPVKDSLSKEARERLYKNPLRILDSKDPKTKEIAMEAPSILDDLSEPARQHFEQVKSYLDVLKIPYVINDRLVRGLDYYTHTAFEFMVDVPGAQAGTIGGGGRYNGLVEEFGGPEMPGFGFGIGLERVLLALEEQKVEIPVEDGIDCYLITIGEKAKTAGAKWLKALREAGIAADQDYLGRKMKAQFKAADRSNARFAVILGEDEMEQGRINVKHLDSGEQETIELEQLIPYIKANIRRR